MGRPERPIDADSGPVADLARALRLLRDQAGRPGYRELARRTHYSVSTLSQATGGRRLPSLQVTLAFAQACGGDPKEWQERWRRASQDAAGSDDPQPVQSTDADITAPQTESRTESSRASHTASDAASRTELAGTQPPGRWRRLAAPTRLIGVTLVLAVAVTVVVMVRHQGGHPAAASPRPTPTFVALPGIDPPRAPANKKVRKQGTTTLRAGTTLDLDAAPDRDWPHAEGGSGPPGDLEFRLADRILVSINGRHTALAYITKPTNAYDDCLTQHYDGVVRSEDVVIGAEFCLITSSAHRALVRITDLKKDGSGPFEVGLYITTWTCVVRFDECT